LSTIFDIRNIRLPRLSRTTVIVGSLVVVVALVVGYVGYRLFEKLTNNTVVAYFPTANALY
jgi:phospholipid/cholesterol/gamma-HCH transport system substrate-binding protein